MQVEVHDIPRAALRELPNLIWCTKRVGRFLLVQRFLEDLDNSDVLVMESADSYSHALLLQKMRRAKEFWDCYVLTQTYKMVFVPSQMEIWRVVDAD